MGRFTRRMRLRGKEARGEQRERALRRRMEETCTRDQRDLDRRLTYARTRGRKAGVLGLAREVPWYFADGALAVEWLQAYDAGVEARAACRLDRPAPAPLPAALAS